MRSIFPKDLIKLIERFALFLIDRLGGAADYTAKRGKQSLVCRHAHLAISTDEAERWLTHMSAAADDVGIAEPAKARLLNYFVETAQTLTDPFLPYYHLPLDELRAEIGVNSGLLQQSHMGHSLLRDAVCRWDALRVRLLLELGSDAKTKEPLGHGLLYRATNSTVAASCDEGKEVVEQLIQFGAEVNLHSGPCKTTPLHMAARRGHIHFVDVLLKAGAHIDAKDSKGHTPLRRAANCRQEEMVKYLLLRGASALPQG